MFSNLHAAYLRLRAHSQSMKYLLFFHCNKGYTNAPQCCVVLALPALLCIIYAKIWNTNGWSTSVMASWACCSYGNMLRATQQNVLITFDFFFFTHHLPLKIGHKQQSYWHVYWKQPRNRTNITFSYQYCHVNSKVAFLSTTAVTVTGWGVLKSPLTPVTADVIYPLT